MRPTTSSKARAILAVEVGSGRVCWVAGDDELAALVTRPPAPGTVTDDAGRPVAAGELPLEAARVGRVYPARTMSFGKESAACVLVSVTRPEGPDGTVAELAIVTVEPTVRSFEGARKDLLAITAHELRSPIASLRLDLERLRRRMWRADTVRGADVAGEMERGLRQLARLTLLVQNVLDASRMQTREFALAEETGDLCAIVADVVERLRPHVAAAGCTLHLAPCASIEGRWDPLRLEQVLHNLVTNAVKYGGPGKAVRIGIEHRGAEARIEVSDEGPGVALEDHVRIFEAFARGHDRDDAVATHSLGLGLYIVREIVAAHGGSVHVTSAPGGGARFVVVLPVRASSDADESRNEDDTHGEEGIQQERASGEDGEEEQRQEAVVHCAGDS